MSFIFEFFVGAALIFVFFSIVSIGEGFFGDSGGIIAALVSLGILVLAGEPYFGLLPEYMQKTVTIGHIFGMLTMFIAMEFRIMRKVTEKVQIDGEPRLK